MGCEIKWGSLENGAAANGVYIRVIIEKAMRVITRKEDKVFMCWFGEIAEK